MRSIGILLLAAAAVFATQAHAACPQRVGIGYGDTLSSIANACGINVETLRAANPGLDPKRLQPGTFVVVPRAALPSPQHPVGRPSVRIAPSLVPPATGISPSSTVIEPPRPPVRHQPRLENLPGFPDPWEYMPPRPGQFPKVP